MTTSQQIAKVKDWIKAIVDLPKTMTYCGGFSDEYRSGNLAGLMAAASAAEQALSILTAIEQNAQETSSGEVGEAIAYVQDFVDCMDEEGLDRDNNQRHYRALIKAARETESVKKKLGSLGKGYEKLWIDHELLRAENANNKFMRDQYFSETEQLQSRIKELEAQRVERVTVEQLEQIVNEKIDQETAFTPTGQRHATMCILSKQYPNGLLIVEGE